MNQDGHIVLSIVTGVDCELVVVAGSHSSAVHRDVLVEELGVHGAQLLQAGQLSGWPR